MGVETIVSLVIGIIIVGFLILNLSQVFFFIGLIFGLLSNVFLVFQYIGTSCDLILNVRAWFGVAVVFFIGFQIYRRFFIKNV